MRISLFNIQYVCPILDLEQTSIVFFNGITWVHISFPAVLTRRFTASKIELQTLNLQLSYRSVPSKVSVQIEINNQGKYIAQDSVTTGGHLDLLYCPVYYM